MTSVTDYLIFCTQDSVTQFSVSLPGRHTRTEVLTITVFSVLVTITTSATVVSLILPGDTATIRAVEIPNALINIARRRAALRNVDNNIFSTPPRPERSSSSVSSPTPIRPRASTPLPVRVRFQSEDINDLETTSSRSWESETPPPWNLCSTCGSTRVPSEPNSPTYSSPLSSTNNFTSGVLQTPERRAYYNNTTNDISFTPPTTMTGRD